MGILAHVIGVFRNRWGIFRYSGLTSTLTALLGDFCKPEFEDAILQDGSRFGRINFGGQPQLAAELVRADLGEQGLLLLIFRRFLRLAADDQRCGSTLTLISFAANPGTSARTVI